MAQFMLTEKDNLAKLHLHVGDELRVSLETIPGTGYSWQMAGETEGILSLTGESVEQPAERRLGGAEQQTFSFRVKSSGAQTLRLEYRRPWEKTDQANKTFSAEVISEK